MKVLYISIRFASSLVAFVNLMGRQVDAGPDTAPAKRPTDSGARTTEPGTAAAPAAATETATKADMSEVHSGSAPLLPCMGMPTKQAAQKATI